MKLSTQFLKYCFLIGLNSLLSFKNMFKITYNIKQILSKCRLFLNLVLTIFSVDYRNTSINSFAERAGKSFICQDHMTLQNNNINFSRATLLLCCNLIGEIHSWNSTQILVPVLSAKLCTPEKKTSCGVERLYIGMQ